jgi:photosynthetic reaction center cytochrome c subunit
MPLKAPGLFFPAVLLALAAPLAHADAPKTAGEQFKNIQVLRGVPADQLFPTMQFISASLGVECGFCHVPGKFDSDEKPNKLTARKMIAMTLAINKENFSGRKEVTCYSCHRGNQEPVGTPPVATSDAEPEHAEHTEHNAPPSLTADEILSKYLAAVGGAEALHKVHTRHEEGAIAFGSHQSPIEVFAEAPDKRATVMHSPHGDSITAFDGKVGWLGNSGRPPREMSPAEANAFRLDADLYFPANVKELFKQFRVGHAEKIGDAPAYTLIASRPDEPPVKLYFDESSGLLLRMERYAETPLGRDPTQIDYADYRAVDGVKIPFRWTLARPNGRFTIQIKEVQQNVAIPEDRFAMPPASGGSGESKPSAH